eukprot:NODE_55_length_1541_cov_496.428773_g52_i0.p1 GENE.NODE_55_length_1541_cov_496.428773_g52_i0~~NODE_55_length_1541_cov_496.428773_g52_i0.p1  ORF type:complete len:448 (-),score=94.44 NODE_55_length_1541_cov_496.428773_g52_i0:196-1494(-)
MAEEPLADFDEQLEEYDETAEAPGVQGDATKQTEKGYTGSRISGFRDFLLKGELNRAIQDCGFEHPSEVQHQCIPQAILGQDVMCQAKSGMGKTAVFVLAVLHQLEEQEADKEKFVKCVVTCHTRELAYQIKNEFVRFSKYLPHAKTEVFYGGRDIEHDKAILKKSKDPEFPTIVVATPGRLKALVKGKFLKVDKVKFFIMDEADRMLEALDMRRDVQETYLMTPKDKQVMMFSATLGGDIRATARKFMQNPIEIYVDSESKLTLHGLQQYFVKIDESAKNKKLIDLLDNLEFNQVVIFVKSVQRAKHLNQLLKECAFPSITIHSGLDQEARIKNYQDFKDFKSRILVSTDLFGRGIDIERVNIVVNYDAPDSSDAYLHRVGRAGRFGTKGLAITFLSDEKDTELMDQVQKRFKVQAKDLPDSIEVSTYMQQ